MSDNIVDAFEEGDEFALSPAGASQLISKILAAGGQFELHGNVVRVVSLPQAVKVEVPAPPAEPTPALAPEPEPAPEVAPEPAPEKPARAARKPKVETAETDLPEPDKE